MYDTASTILLLWIAVYLLALENSSDLWKKVAFIVSSLDPCFKVVGR